MDFAVWAFHFAIGWSLLKYFEGIENKNGLFGVGITLIFTPGEIVNDDFSS